MPTSALTKPASNSKDPAYRHISYANIKLMFQMTEAGKTQREIAAFIKCDQSTVSRIMSELSDARDAARRILHHGAVPMAERLVALAEPKEAIEVLRDIDVLPRKESSASASAIQINIGMPGAPAGPDPFLVVSPQAIPDVVDSE